jgi:hypothetical protein
MSAEVVMESAAGLNRNRLQESIGMGGSYGPESATIR